MTEQEVKIEKIYNQIQERIPFTPKVGLVLGSGLGNYAENFSETSFLPYSEMEGFPVSTVQGHQGRFVFAKKGELPIVCMQGRVHYYEGYTMSDVVLPIRLMKKMGVEIVILTNAAGGINRTFVPGDIVVLKDHISSFVPSPLVGPNPDSFGTRFPDMVQVYDKEIREIIRTVYEKNALTYKEGVYLQTTGPQYETPAEIGMFERFGADLVGMSTVVEAIAARHAGLRVAGLSCVTNMASGITGEPLSHEEVKEVSNRVAGNMKCILDGILSELA